MGFGKLCETICKVYLWYYLRISFYSYFQGFKIGVLTVLIKDFGLKNNIKQEVTSNLVLIIISISLIINDFLDFKFIQKTVIKIILEISSFVFVLLICLNYQINVYLQMILACFILTTNFCSIINLVYKQKMNSHNQLFTFFYKNSIFPSNFRYNLVMVICLTVFYCVSDFYSAQNSDYQSYSQQILLIFAGLYGFSQFVNYFLKKNINITQSPFKKNELQDFFYTQETFEQSELQQINKCKKISMVFLVLIVGFNVNYYSIANLTQNFSILVDLLVLIYFQLLFQFVQSALIKIFPILDLTNIIILMNMIVVAQLQIVNNNVYLRCLLLTIIFSQPIIFQSFFRQYTGFIQPHKWIKVIIAVFMIFYSINDMVVKYLIVGEDNFYSTMKQVNIYFQAFQIVQNCLSLALIFLFEIYLKKQLPQSYQRSIFNLQL